MLILRYILNRNEKVLRAKNYGLFLIEMESLCINIIIVFIKECLKPFLH